MLYTISLEVRPSNTASILFAVAMLASRPEPKTEGCIRIIFQSPFVPSKDISYRFNDLCFGVDSIKYDVLTDIFEVSSTGHVDGPLEAYKMAEEIVKKLSGHPKVLSIVHSVPEPNVFP